MSPGRHWTLDIPRLSAEAAKNHPGVRYQVTSPLGLHELMAEVMSLRIAQCLRRSLGDGEACDLCRPTGGCVMHGVAGESSRTPGAGASGPQNLLGIFKPIGSPTRQRWECATSCAPPKLPHR